jgi:hypothetical protein
MKKAPRNFLFVLVLIIFVISAPILILYALGYRYDSDSHTLRKTATIALEFESQSIKAYFDDIFVAEKKDSVIIPGVTRALHHITLTKNDAISWSQSVETSPGVVTWLSNIILYRANLGKSATTKAGDDVLAAKISTTQNSFALVVTHAGDNFSTIEIRDKKTQSIVVQVSEKSIRDSLKNTVTEFTYYDMFFTQNDSWLVIPIKLTDGGATYIALSTKDGSFYSLENFIPKSATSVLYPDSKDQLVYFYVESGKRQTFDLQKKTLSSPSNVLYSFHKSFASYNIEDNNGICSVVETLDVIATTKTLATIDCGNMQVFITPNNNLILKNFTTHKVDFFDTHAKAFLPLGQDASHFTFASKPKSGDIFTYVVGSELHAYTSETNETMLLARTSEDISDVVVSSLGTHVVYLSGQTLTAEEITNTRTPVSVSWDLDDVLPFVLPGSLEETVFIAEKTKEDSSAHQLNEVRLYDL